jgi:hypothetical protein
MLSPTSGVGARSSAGSEQQWWRCDLPCSLPQEGEPRWALAPYRREVFARIRPILVGHAVDLATAQPRPGRRPGPNRYLRCPAQPAPASTARLRLGQTTSRSWTRRATTPTPAIPAVRRPAPPPCSTTSLRSDTADGGTDKHRTPTPDAGRLDAQTPAPDTGHRSSGQARVDTGR